MEAITCIHRSGSLDRTLNTLKPFVFFELSLGFYGQHILTPNQNCLLLNLRIVEHIMVDIVPENMEKLNNFKIIHF